jgi:hypothetical protein
VEDDRTAEERAPVIINIAKARGTAAVRLLAVGVLLSALNTTTNRLVSYMKNVWGVRGHLECLQLADSRFVLEFSSTGDYEHVTTGGPWRYQGDAVLVRKLEDHEDPDKVPFETVPIWVQFWDLPFYLLSKQLARNLGEKLGELICIDNHARGDIANKILRARVHLPVARALQRWITLEDVITCEEVVVRVFYERLPNYCTCCGVIGHLAADCELPVEMRRTRYCNNLGVPPTHRDDPRRWYLAESALENGRALQLDTPWRNVAAFGARRDQDQRGTVTLVTREVEKLSVKDGDASKEKDRNANKNEQAITNTGDTMQVTDIVGNTEHASDNTGIIDNTAITGNTDHASDNPGITEGVCVMAGDTNILHQPPSVKATDKGMENVDKEAGITDPAPPSLHPPQATYHTNSEQGAEARDPAKRSWKRVARIATDGEGAKQAEDDRSTLAPAEGGSVLGKRQNQAVMVYVSRNKTITENKKKKAEDAVLGLEAKASVLGVGEDKEATSPGATGQLTGASVGACQKS